MSKPPVAAGLVGRSAAEFVVAEAKNSDDAAGGAEMEVGLTDKLFAPKRERPSQAKGLSTPQGEDNDGSGTDKIKSHEDESAGAGALALQLSWLGCVWVLIVTAPTLHTSKDSHSQHAFAWQCRLL